MTLVFLETFNACLHVYQVCASCFFYVFSSFAVLNSPVVFCLHFTDDETACILLSFTLQA